MSSLSERLAALNRTTGPAQDAESTEDGQSPSPKRRADVPTDAPATPEATPAKTHTSVQGTHAGNAAPVHAPPASGTQSHGSTSGPSGLGKAVGASSHQSRAAATTATRTDAAKDRFEDLKENVHTELLQQLGPQLYDANLDAEELATKVRTVLADVLAATNRPLTRVDRERITQDIADDILGYGPLEPYLRDTDVTEVMVNGPFSIWLERKGKLTQVDGKFNDEAHLRRTIDKIVSRIGRRVDEASPMVDARLPDGSRVNAVVPPLAIDGSLAHHPQVRRRPADGRRPDPVRHAQRPHRGLPRRLRARPAQRPRLRRYRRRQDHHPQRALVVHPRRRAHRHHRGRRRAPAPAGPRRPAGVAPANIEGKGEVTIRDLVRNSLRMRPDRIVVGEVRDAAALDMLQAMNTGHDGSICTVHSNSPRDTLLPPRDHGADGRHGPAGPGHPRAGRLGRRPDRAPGASQGRHPSHHARHRGRAAWRVTSSRCRTSSCSTTPPGFDDEGRSLGTPEVHRSATQVPGEAAAQQRHRRPAALRHRDGLPMTRHGPPRHLDGPGPVPGAGVASPCSRRPPRRQPTPTR